MKQGIHLAIILFSLFFSLNTFSQICSGTLTAVWRDDFGSGTDQLSATGSPSITSGYTYENFGIDAAHYALVNKFDYYNSWHVVPEDHTPLDTGGYFLVIDGNSSAPIFYDATVNNVCPFTQYSFSTFAMNIDLPQFPSDQTFTFIISDLAGNQLATWDSPPITATATPIWVPMGFSFNSGNNTSLKLQARFNATGYDDFAFDDFQFSVCGPTLSITSPIVSNTCADNIPLFTLLGSGYANPVYQWQKKDSSGTFINIPNATQASYTDSLPGNSNDYTVIVGDGTLSCPIKQNKEISITAAKRGVRSKSICNGANFEGHTIAGNYIDTLIASNGCDSIRTLQLSVNNCTTSIDCNNWLFNPSASSSVNIGDLDVPGDKITVEAVINRTTAYSTTTADNSEGDVVSKHNSPSDVNYLLRPNHAFITTTNGFFSTPDICAIQLNKTYHIAMVYDGSTLKFYRDGFLMSQVNATGNLFQNNWNTRIGHYDPAVWLTQFVGYTNEVRIWNVARSQAELIAFMNTPLPTPTTQTGLLAYYQFDNLLNKQGNTTFNGVINGNAVISSTNPDCAFVVDSCPVILSTGISGIINDYTPVIDFNSCKNLMTVEDASAYNTGDTVLIIQMKGAVVDSTNTSNFGTITDYKNAGNYEFNYVKSKSGNVIELRNVLLRQYDVPDGKVQLIRVPYYQNAVVTNTLTCLPWDGRKGGVLVLKAKDTIALQADIDVSNKGFAGGKGTIFVGGTFNCFLTDYYMPFNFDSSGMKGESISAVSLQKMYAKGRNGGGGGGGMNHNGGGGGGGNGGTGGTGGYTHINCSNHTSNFCLAGNPLIYSNANNKAFMGSGGGAGQANNGSDASGANGGGLAIISSNYLSGNSKFIIADGGNAPECNPIGNPNISPCHDGGGGGGAGGTILLDINNAPTNVNINLNGGNGANLTYIGGSSAGLGPLGPGAGGGGGVAWIKNPLLSASLSISNQGGKNGVILADNNDPWGAQSGLQGVSLNNLIIPADGPLFKANIDSIKITDSLSACKTFTFKSVAYTNRAAIQSWLWNFGDNSFASSQNTSHTYTSVGTYTVKLIVTDINNCKDSISKTITVNDCLTNIINDYAAVLSIDICSNKITVDNASKFNIGDTIVLMQMKGAAIDSTNSITFGIINNYNNAGRYEFNYVKNKTGNSIEMANTFLNKYDAVAGRVQLIRVPYYQILNITDTLTCLPWDGSKGGVLIVNSATDINIHAPINVSNKGFRGGAVGGGFSCDNISSWSAPTGIGGTKGEGVTDYIPGLEAGGARLANGGGGAYAANSGGGGGGNFGEGGLGGLHSNTCPSPTQSINGQGLNYANSNVIFLGGGGGGGQQDNGQPVAAGGDGGGIVIMKAVTLNGNNQPIIANGESVTTLVRDEGGGGGGAGGSVLLFVNNYIGTLSIDGNGGNGSSNDNQIYPGRCHGPGGGGGGGYIGLSVANNPANIVAALNGGRAGLVLNPASDCFNTTNGATDGVSGNFNFNVVLPEATVPFKKNIDSIRINNNLAGCKTFNLNGLGFTNTSPVINWQWNFGDGEKDSVQNTSHTYAANGPNNIKLIATDINGCKDSISKVITTSGINFDFVFEQDACNPRSVIFKAVGDTTTEIFWSLGDGTITNNIRNPLHVFADTGYFLVEYSTGNISTGCIDTVRKTIFIGWRNANIILTPDTTICFGTSKLLRSNIDSSLQFCWSPNNFLNNVNFANPTTSTPSSIIYLLIATSQENNLVLNGNFNNGNMSFTSDYNLGAPPLGTREYVVATSSLNIGPAAVNCNDHTTGTGSMLVARNDFTAKSKIWSQSITVSPNTNYTFSAWLQSLISPNNAQLQLIINGNTVEDNILLPTANCMWVKHSVLWNSGNNTTANLSIINKIITPGIGGYLAIDDISFASYSIKRDTIKIIVDTPFVDTRTDTSICESLAIKLTTVGANSYVWTPAAGLSNALVESPVATPSDTTKYFVTGTNNFGCKAIDSVTIYVKPKPVATTTGDTTICRNTSATLFASGGSSYVWSPAAMLNNAAIASPTTNPTTLNTKYVVTVTGSNNCITKDSFTVKVSPVPVYTISADKSVCLNTKAQLNASGGNYYLWSPALLVSNANISNPLAVSVSNTLYSVLIKDTACGNDTTLTTNIIILPLPIITTTKENDINCAVGSSQLSANGAAQYNWAPAGSLSDANSASPVASPVNTTIYTVKGTDTNSCSNTATVTVFTNYTNKVTYDVPNAFSPDGNGINDCFKVKYFGLITDLQFAVYNRWGQKVFFSTNTNDCWDGTYKGSPCDAGNFVYYIKAKTTCGLVERKGNIVLIR